MLSLVQSALPFYLASRGNTMPFVVASYQMYGLHPDKVYPAILARRTALLGPSGESMAISPVQDALPAPSPKKAIQSVKFNPLIKRTL